LSITSSNINRFSKKNKKNVKIEEKKHLEQKKNGYVKRGKIMRK